MSVYGAFTRAAFIGLYECLADDKEQIERLGENWPDDAVQIAWWITEAIRADREETPPEPHPDDWDRPIPTFKPNIMRELAARIAEAADEAEAEMAGGLHGEEARAEANAEQTRRERAYARKHAVATRGAP